MLIKVYYTSFTVALSTSIQLESQGVTTKLSSDNQGFFVEFVNNI